MTTTFTELKRRIHRGQFMISGISYRDRRLSAVSRNRPHRVRLAPEDIRTADVMLGGVWVTVPWSLGEFPEPVALWEFQHALSAINSIDQTALSQVQIQEALKMNVELHSIQLPTRPTILGPMKLANDEKRN
jgi:hypothetical protein